VIPEEEWTKAAETLRAAQEIVVCCHVSPDGDALGSMLGLGRFLGRSGKKVWMSWGSERVQAPPQYSFMPGADLLVPPEVVPQAPETFVAIDCGDIARLGLLRPRFESARSTINIDHHVSNDRFADINLVDPEGASSSELAYDLVRRMGGTPNIEEATCFYTGIVTDTGRFQYANTSPATLRAAAELREIGVDHERIATEVYESTSFGYLQALGVVLFRARLEDGLVWSRLDQKDLGELDLDETEHFIDALRTVRESRLAVLLKELPTGGYKASLRSRGEVDVAEIARSLGGGGHSRASGFEMSADPEEIIEAIRARLPKQAPSPKPPGEHSARIPPPEVE
jgi:phosphoesterase RecJ-like protein